MNSPVQDLYLYSLDKNNNLSFKGRDILYCIIYELIGLNKIKFNNNKFALSKVDDDELMDAYLIRFLELLKYKRYAELKTFIESIHFKPYLINKGYIKVNKLKGFFKKESVQLTNNAFEYIAENQKQSLFNFCPSKKYEKEINSLVGRIIAKFQELEAQE